MTLIAEFDWLFYGILCVLALMQLLCLIRAVIGPRIADRLVAVNMITTMVIVMIGILAVLKGEGYLIDICLVYAMISFLAVVVLSRIYTGEYREAKQRQQEKEEKKNADS